MKAFEIGERVYVRHIGLEKIGRIVKIGPKRAHVEVEIGRGAAKALKVIVRPLAEIAREPERPRLVPFRA